LASPRDGAGAVSRGTRMDDDDGELIEWRLPLV